MKVLRQMFNQMIVLKSYLVKETHAYACGKSELQNFPDPSLSSSLYSGLDKGHQSCQIKKCAPTPLTEETEQRNSPEKIL